MTLSATFYGAAAQGICIAALMVATSAVAATPSPPAPAPAAELLDTFTYGPLRFHVESLALDGSVSARAKVSIENLSHSIARVVLAAMSGESNGVGLSLANAAGTKCEAKDKEISEIKLVDAAGETKIRAMTQIQALSRLTFAATFHCSAGHLSTADKLAMHGRVLTATEAGGFDIPLNFIGLTAAAK